MNSTPNKRTLEERTIAAIEKKQRLLAQQQTLFETYNKLQREVDNYSAMFLTYENIDEKYLGRNNPIIIGNAHTRMSILDIGKVNTEKAMIINGYVFPEGYRAKRKYLRHYDCSKKTSDDKIFYFCDVDSEWSIKCTCGKLYKDFELFANDFQAFDIGSVEEFFGLTHANVVVMIEEMKEMEKLKEHPRHKKKK